MKMAGAKKIHLPVLVEKDKDGFFVVECPLLQGCYTQGKTLDEALKNIHEVIDPRVRLSRRVGRDMSKLPVISG